MESWTPDAAEIGKIYENDLVITPSIREFIHPDKRDRIFYVVAPKGIGKSLLLMYKRQLYDTKPIETDPDIKGDLYLIPKDLQVDRCLDITRYTLTKEKIDLLSDYSNCKEVWKFCISLSIIKNVLRFYKPRYLEELTGALNELLKGENYPKHIEQLIQDQNMLTPGDIFNEVLKLNYKNIISVIRHQNRVSQIIRNYIRSGVAVFIDNVDQSFEDYLQSKDVHYDLYKSMWYTGQIGLIFAVHELSSINSHIKVYISVRKEAFQKMREVGSLGSQIRGKTLDITYTANQLKDIFIKNIRITNEEDLVIPKDKKENPLHAFLGLKNNEIDTIKGTREDIFCYIHRHSLKRPRDLMVIGREIKKIAVRERNRDNIRKAVNSAAHEILTDFLSEIQPFTNVDFNKLFGLIHSNVLNRDEIKDICGKYNEKCGCIDEDCDQCNGTHVFCELYNSGLLGVVVRDLIDRDKFTQKFMQIGEIDYGWRTLPYSGYYLTHPALISHIEQANLRQRNEFNPVSNIIIGDGYPWKDFFKDDNGTVSVLSEDKKEEINDKKKYFPFFRNELLGFSATRKQKEPDCLNEADSKTLEILRQKLSDIVESGAKIQWLDVGCGNGRCLEVLDKINKLDNIFYHGVDSEYTFAAATNKAKKYGIEYNFERIHAENLNFENKYNLISAILLFHEVDPLKLPHVLRNLIVALEDDGVLIISDFQEPYEIEKNVVIWPYEDIRFILNQICRDVQADFSTVPSTKNTKEFSFYHAIIKKTEINDVGFEDFFENYDLFLHKKKYDLLLKRNSLRTQMKTKSREILGENIDAETLTEDELEYIRNTIEIEYFLKAYKSHLICHEIEFLDQVLGRFSK